MSKVTYWEVNSHLWMWSGTFLWVSLGVVGRFSNSGGTLKFGKGDFLHFFCGKFSISEWIVVALCSLLVGGQENVWFA